MERDDPQSARASSRFVWRAMLLVAALVAVVWVALYLDRRLQRDPLRARWERTVAEMRAAGEPLDASDLYGRALPRERELGAWLDGFEKRADASWVEAKSRSHSAAAEMHALPYLERAALAGGLDAWLVLQAVLGEDRAWPEVRDRRPDALEALRGLRARDTSLHAGLEALDTVEGIDAVSWVERVLDIESRTPPDATIAFAAAEMLALDALLAGVDGDRDAIERDLRRMLVLSRTGTDAPSMIAHGSGCSVVYLTCVVIEESIDLLSAPFVVEELEPVLAAVDLRAGLVRATRAETACLVDAPLARRILGMPLDAPAEELARYLDVPELKNLLDEMQRRRAITAAFALPAVPARAAVVAACDLGARAFRRPDTTPYPVANVLTPTFQPAEHLDVLERTTERVLELMLVRVRLRARVAGLEQARELTALLEDPYDGRPLRTRLAEDGTLLVWSVGPDGVDSGGASDDVRLELAEK